MLDVKQDVDYTTITIRSCLILNCMVEQGAMLLR